MRDFDEIQRLDGELAAARAEIERLTRGLAAMTAARNEACQIGRVAVGRLRQLEHDADWQADDSRLGELAAVGKEPT